MRQNISKFSFLIIAAAAAFGFSASLFTAKAAPANPPAFALTLGDKTFDISEDLLSKWKQPTGDDQTTFLLAPEKNLNNYVLVQMGVRSPIFSKIDFQKYNINAMYSYIRTLEPQIDQPTQDAVLKTDGDKVTEFNPGQNGLTLDVKGSIDSIIKALNAGQNTSKISVIETQPTRDLASVNDLGIKELIAVGTSDFSGSPSNRIFNIKVGVQKETGVLIKQGEEFSFNKFLGPVDGEHGFLPELVIKKTGTVPEFGGGLCQVSSTVFRAAMNAGFPITQRRNHSYAVSYYAPQGTDATIYPGVQDLKFINDSPGTILVWPTILPKNKLQFAIYGIKDSRQVSFDGPYSYDKKPDGSMKATWTRNVTMPSGEVLKATFNSVYLSPALFHKTTELPGAGGATPTPTPTGSPTPSPSPSPTHSPTPTASPTH